MPLRDDDLAEELWSEVYNSTGRQKIRVKEHNILAGMILPIWAVIDKALSGQSREHDKQLQVVRLQMTNNDRRLVGVLVPQGAMEMVLDGLQSLKLAMSSGARDVGKETIELLDE